VDQFPNLRALALGALCAGLMVGASAAGAADAVVAKVNGQDITEADLALAEADIGPALGNLAPSARRRVFVEYIIETRLFAEAAEADKLASGPEFDRRVAYWRQRALRDAYFEKSVKGAIGEGTVKGIYDDKVKMIPPEDEVSARHVLVETEEEAKEIADKIGKGGDIGALAKERSQDTQSKEDGGSLGYFARGQMVGPFGEAAFALKPGEVSKPVKTQFGWHVIKVEDRRPKKPPQFEEVKDKILDSMVQSKAQDVAGLLREKAKIEYVDAEIKKQAEQDAAKAAAQKKAFEMQMNKQLDAK
jgi:peptidyl-prolyl cis-trans isomerase C